MKSIFLLGLVLCISATLTAQSRKTGDSMSKGQCSPSNTGNNNKFVINCGIGKAQGQQMIEILNKVLSNQLDPAVVMAKLDEILRRTNPNLTVTTYNCQGGWRKVTQSTGEEVVSNDSPGVRLKPMSDLLVAGRYPELLDKCLAEIREKPEWLTPRLFCSDAYLETGDRVEAKAMLTEYESNAGKAYFGDPFCVNLASRIRQRIQ